MIHWTILTIIWNIALFPRQSENGTDVRVVPKQIIQKYERLQAIAKTYKKEEILEYIQKMSDALTVHTYDLAEVEGATVDTVTGIEPTTPDAQNNTNQG